MRSDSIENPSPCSAAVAVVVRHGDHALALRRCANAAQAPGLWGIVSGRVEANESLLEAAKRELLEESGLRIELDPRPVDAYLFSRGHQATLLVVYSAGTVHTQIQLSDEHDDYRWWTLEEFQRANTPPRLVDAIRRAFEKDPVHPCG